MPFRTWDAALRAERHAVLVKAALAADDAARTAGITLLVSGSLSRGQTHPWSDLDLIITPLQPTTDFEESPWEAINAIQDATGLYDDVDVVPADEVIEPLRPGLLGSAVPVAALPPLGALPDPELAIPRCAISMETMLPHVRLALEASDRYVPLPGEDPDLTNLMRSSSLSRQRDQLAYRVAVSLKRLAVFQDGGQSGWLDGNDGELPDLLERLCMSADEPFQRPAVVVPQAAHAITWLLEHGVYSRFDRETEAGELREGLAACADGLAVWASHLRSVTSLTETHGLTPRA